MHNSKNCLREECIVDVKMEPKRTYDAKYTDSLLSWIYINIFWINSGVISQVAISTV